MICKLIDFALVVLWLLMFNICGIIGILKVDFFKFPVLKGLGKGRQNHEIPYAYIYKNQFFSIIVCVIL